MPDIQGNIILPDLPQRFRLSLEFRLLLACSLVVPPALEIEHAERVAHLCDDSVDWDIFVGLVDRHRVPALVYDSLCRYGGKLPVDIREKLKQRSNQARRQALRCAAELVRLVRLFAAQKIELIPLKGPLLSQQLFGDPGTRHSRDIDLLVMPGDLENVHKLLADEGYQCVFPGFELTPAQLDYIRTGVHHFEYFHGENGLTLEIHWRSFMLTPEQVAGMWRRCLPVGWMGTRITCLDEDDLILYLCDHGAGHKWFRIKWLSDIAMLFSRDRSDGWNNLLAMAEQLDLRRTLAQTALLVHWLYEITLPLPILRLVEEEKTALKLGIPAVSAMLASEEFHLTAGRRFGNMRRARYFKRLKPTMSFSMVLKIILVCPDDFKQFPLPKSLFWLYIPLRPLFWFLRNYTKKPHTEKA